MEHNKEVKEFFDDLLEKEWMKVWQKEFSTATRQCARSGCKRFGIEVEKMLAKATGKDNVIFNMSLDLTDYTATSINMLNAYATSVFGDDKIKKLMAKKGLIFAISGVRETQGRDPETKEVVKRVLTIYCFLVTPVVVDALNA
jgi:hypothetical protein